MTVAARLEDTDPLPRQVLRVYRASRPRLDVVSADLEDGERPSDFMKSARYSCSLCGMRSVESQHPVDPATGLAACVLAGLKR